MSPARFNNIDGLRAIAALSVMVEHFLGDMLRHTAPGIGSFRASAVALVDSVSLGRFGVALFFLISGFVVPFSIRGERPLTTFAISRIFRLYPVLWLALAVLTVTAWGRGQSVTAATILANMTLAPTVLGQPWLSPIYWTLFIEIIFYALAAGLFRLGALFRPWSLLGLAVTLIASSAVPVLFRELGLAALPVQYIGLHLAFLFTGLLLRLGLVERVPGALTAAATVVILALAAVWAVSDFSLARGDSFILIGRLPVISAYLAALAVFVAAVMTGRPRSPRLAAIGLISYSMYLFHFSVNEALFAVLPLTGGFGDVGVMILCLSATLLVSTVTYRLVERPFVRLGHRMIRQEKKVLSATP